MINLLLLSAGTNANYQIARTLKKHFSDQIRVVGADINPRHLIATGVYLDAFYQVPLTKDVTYYPAILDICRQEKIDFLLPSFDADQMLFYPENQDLVGLGVRSLGTPQKSLPIYKNKAEMNAFLNQNQFPIPKIYTTSECEDETVYMAKPINGVGSLGAGLKTGAEIKKIENVDNYIIQEQLFEPEITMECFYFNEQFSCVCRDRLATKAGVCTKARLFNNATLAEIGLQFAKTLATPFIFNLQFMRNKDGKYCITDVNLRTAGGMGLSYAAGWDEISALAKIMLGKQTDEAFETLPTVMPETYVVRANEDIVTQKAHPVVAFDFDGTLLDSRKRHQVVMDDILAQFGIQLDTSDLIEFKSNGKNNVDFLISKGIDEKKAKEIQQKWIENIEKEEYLALDVLYADAIEQLEKYKNAGYDLILVTARNNEQGLQNQLDKLNLRGYFKGVFVVKSGKEAVDQKAEILKAQRAILMVGDTRSDALSAQNAGVAFQFHENGFHKKEVIER